MTNQNVHHQRRQRTEDRTYPPEMPEARVEVYKTVDGVDLRLWIFEPDGSQPDRACPATIFFFGGGWRGGSPAQFRQHCRYLAGRGMVAISADYRVRSRHGVKPSACVADAKSAVRWIRVHADRLGIDPNRLVAAGGSSGGHLAAATATLPSFDDPQDDISISARPNALVLFNPGLVLTSIPGKLEMPEARIAKLVNAMDVEPSSLSPYLHLTSDVPPTLIVHGTADEVVPYETVALFRQGMADHGNRCELVGYEGCGHAFFNYGRNHNALFVDTVHRMDVFLTSLGYLEAPPEVRVER